jgi:ADP-ribose pyrophosphatase YjhB (NUDIX family)
VNERRFARLRNGPATADVNPVPDDGMCLNAFLVVRSRDRPGEVLLGQVDPAAPWGPVGGLGPDRIARIGDRWMLPASQLLLLESPDDAARRLARELLGREIEPLPAPRVLSETYRRAGSTASDPHWDLHYVYEVEGPGVAPARGRMWRRLDYRPVRTMAPEEFARGHHDVLALVGLRGP